MQEQVVDLGSAMYKLKPTIFYASSGRLRSGVCEGGFRDDPHSHFHLAGVMNRQQPIYLRRNEGQEPETWQKILSLLMHPGWPGLLAQ